jgi:hypothetical protein
MVFFPSSADSDKPTGLTKQQIMQQKMQKQRQLSLERQRNVAKATFVGVTAQEVPLQQEHGYIGSPNLPRAIIPKSTTSPQWGANTMSQDQSGTKESETVAGLLSTMNQQVEDMPRCQTAQSNVSNVELLSNDGDGRPGFERCGGQQGPGKNTETTTWDLSVNVGAPQAVESSTTGATTQVATVNSKRWWKPSMPFRGNRNASASPNPSNRIEEEGITVENVAAFDRSTVRTPDSTDRTFHGPNRRAPLGEPSSSSKPPMPARRSPVTDVMPGAIVDVETSDDALPSAPAFHEQIQPIAGGNFQVNRQSQPSPNRFIHQPAPVAQEATTEVCAFQSDTVVEQFPQAKVQEAAPSTVLGFQSNTVVEELPQAKVREAPSPVLGQRGGRRGWRPWRANKDTSSFVDEPKQEAAISSEVCPFPIDD